MQTKQEYEDIVSYPGKFESEPAYTPYYYDMYLEGMHDYYDEDDNPVFDITEDDVKMFPELSGNKHATLIEDSNGFVYCILS